MLNSYCYRDGTYVPIYVYMHTYMYARRYGCASRVLIGAPPTPGFTESMIPTGFMTIVSGYYTQQEQALRQSWWFSGTGWFTIIGGAFNYGFAQIHGNSLASWQYIYIFAGLLTCLFAVWCLFIPNSPQTAWFLTPEERVVAVKRLKYGQTGIRNQTIKLDQIKEAALDPKIYLVFLIMASA